MAIAVLKFKIASATETSQYQYYEQLKKNKEKTHVIVDGRMAPWLAHAGIFLKSKGLGSSPGRRHFVCINNVGIVTSVLYMFI